MVQKNLQTLLLPPYNAHTTFSIGGSIICGYEFEAVEFFPVLISYLHVEIEYLDNQYSNSIERLREQNLTLKAWLNGLEQTLKKGNDIIKERVIEAWINNISSMKTAFQKTKGYENRLRTVWGEFLKTTMINQCPCCPSNLGPFETHMMSQHVEIVLTQEKRGKKRARNGDVLTE